jgi:hypothetical protein
MVFGGLGPFLVVAGVAGVWRVVSGGIEWVWAVWAVLGGFRSVSNRPFRVVLCGGGGE